MEDLIINIEGGSLLNPKMRITQVSEYDTVTNEYSVKVAFRENGGLYEHTRIYSFVNEKLGGLDFPDVITALKTHPDIGATPLVLNDGTEV